MGSQENTAMLSVNIQALRKQRSWTQADLAKKLGLSRASVNAWEMGISIPSTRYIVELARLFHVSTDFLLGIDINRTIDASDLTDNDIRLLTEIAQHLREMRRSEYRLSVRNYEFFEFLRVSPKNQLAHRRMIIRLRT